MRSALRSCLLFALLPSAAVAQDFRQPVQELFFTEVVYPQDKGETQVTATGLIDRAQPTTLALIPLSIEYGITGRWQIEAGLDGATESTRPVAGVQRVRTSVGTKYSFMNVAGWPLHIATGLNLEFVHDSAFTSDTGEQGIDFEPFVALAADLGRHVTLAWSGTASRNIFDRGDLADTIDDTGTISGGVLCSLGAVTLAAEYTSRSDELPWRIEGAALLTPSLIVHPGHAIEIGAGLPIAMRHGQRKPGIAVNVIKEFGGRD